jgi:hypothetical protein
MVSVPRRELVLTSEFLVGLGDALSQWWNWSSLMIGPMTTRTGGRLSLGRGTGEQQPDLSGEQGQAEHEQPDAGPGRNVDGE